jgi:hypothetical protein
MKSAGTISISIALRSIVVSIFGVVLMFMTSPLLSALTLACLPARARANGPATGGAAMRGLFEQGLRAAHVLSRLPGPHGSAVGERAPVAAARRVWPALCWRPAALHAGSATDSIHNGERLASSVIVRG